MKKKLSLCLLCIFLVLSAGLLSATALELEVTKCKGAAYFRKEGTGQWDKMTVGERLGIGTEIYTAEESSTELELENIFIRLNPGTHLVIKNLTKKGRTLRLELEETSGGIWSKVVKTLHNLIRYEVVTPTAVAGVEGTVFKMRHEAETTEVMVAEGLVKVMDVNGDELVLQAREKVKLSKEGMQRQSITNRDREEIEKMNRWGQKKEEGFTQGADGQYGEANSSQKSGMSNGIENSSGKSGGNPSGSGSGNGGGGGNGSGKGGAK